MSNQFDVKQAIIVMAVILLMQPQLNNHGIVRPVPSVRVQLNDQQSNDNTIL